MSLNLIKEAILGGYEEAMSMPTPQQRIRRGFVVLQKFCGEVVGILKTVPYGVRCLRTYKRTPPTHQSVSYGSHERHSLDLYVPTPSDSRPDVQQPRLQNPSEVGAEKGITGPQHHILQVLQSDAKEQDGSGELPVVIFVPGNVWAASEKWQYAFFAKRLQNEGFLTAILDYPLYPQAKIEEMVASVGEAIVWMQHNAETFGGNKHRICVVGQSAGTQLTSMWLLEQSKRLADGASSSYSLSSTTLPVVDVSPMENGSILDSSLESTMASGTEKHPGALAKPVEMEGIPAAFLAMNGVYELEQHYRYEQSRGVAGISMMKRCMRGDLAKWSPSVLLDSLMSDAQSTKDTRTLLQQIFPQVTFVHGKPDIMAPCYQSERFNRQLQSYGFRSSLVHLESTNHSDNVLVWPAKDEPDQPEHVPIILDALADSLFLERA